MTKKRRMAIGAVLGAIALSAGVALAQVPAFFRIGTGGTAGTYYPVGGLIANTISATGGGVAGPVATAVSSNGSVANISAVNGGSLESGFSQSGRGPLGHNRPRPVGGKGKKDKPRAHAPPY